MSELQDITMNNEWVTTYNHEQVLTNMHFRLYKKLHKHCPFYPQCALIFTIAAEDEILLKDVIYSHLFGSVYSKAN